MLLLLPQAVRFLVTAFYYENDRPVWDFDAGVSLVFRVPLDNMAWLLVPCCQVGPET